jgi:hypothetical protein
MEGPICSCEHENLSWDFDIDYDVFEFAGVTIECETCGEQLYVYREQFGAYFKFEQGYPKGRLVEEEVEADIDIEVEMEIEGRPFLTLIHGGKDEMDS